MRFINPIDEYTLLNTRPVLMNAPKTRGENTHRINTNHLAHHRNQTPR
ncbi:MAG: hypothetical protein ACWA5W_06955 [Phycisphaerales bacterium]